MLEVSGLVFGQWVTSVELPTVVQQRVGFFCASENLANVQEHGREMLSSVQRTTLMPDTPTLRVMSELLPTRPGPTEHRPTQPSVPVPKAMSCPTYPVNVYPPVHVPEKTTPDPMSLLVEPPLRSI